MKAVGYNIVIKTETPGTKKTKGGLLLTESQRVDVRYQKAEVLAIGPDVIGINEGDNIFFDKRAATRLVINKDIFHVIKYSDVVVVL